MTTPINNIIRGGAQGRSIFPSALPVLSSAVNYNQGDLLCYDGTNHVLIPAATGNFANFLGVAINTVVNGVAKSPYQGTAVDASTAASDMGGPLYGVVVTLTADTGSNVYPGSPVYISSVGAQNVTSVDPSSADSIGIYMGTQGTIASTTAGQKIDILIGSRYAQNGLRF